MAALNHVFISDDLFARSNIQNANNFTTLNAWMRSTFPHNTFWLSLSHPNPNNVSQILYLHARFNRTVGSDGLANMSIDRIYKDANSSIQGQGTATDYNYAQGTVLTKAALQSLVNAPDATPFTTGPNHQKNFSQYVLFFAEPPRLDPMLNAVQSLLRGDIPNIALSTFSVIVTNYGKMLRSATPIPSNLVVTWNIARNYFLSPDRTAQEKREYNTVCDILGLPSQKVPVSTLRVASQAIQVWGLQDKVYTFGEYLNEEETPKVDDLQEQFTAHIFVSQNKVVKSHGSEADVQRLANAVLLRGDAALAESVYEPSHLWFHDGGDVQYYGAFGSDQIAREAAANLFEGKHTYIVVSKNQVVHAGNGAPDASEVLPSLRAIALRDL